MTPNDSRRLAASAVYTLRSLLVDEEDPKTLAKIAGAIEHSVMPRLHSVQDLDFLKRTLDEVAEYVNFKPISTFMQFKAHLDYWGKVVLEGQVRNQD